MYLLFVWWYWGVLGHRNIFQTLVSYVCVWLHLILRFAGCGLLSLFPCRILPCLCGCAPFYRCDIAVKYLRSFSAYCGGQSGGFCSLILLSLLLFSMSQDFSSCFVRCSASLGAEHCSTSVKSVFSSLCCGMCVLLACGVLCLRWLRCLRSLSSP